MLGTHCLQIKYIWCHINGIYQISLLQVVNSRKFTENRIFKIVHIVKNISGTFRFQTKDIRNYLRIIFKNLLVSDVCVMDGKQYTQGQKWYQGCQKICICNDGKTGAYTCTERFVVFVTQFSVYSLSC